MDVIAICHGTKESYIFKFSTEICGGPKTVSHDIQHSCTHTKFQIGYTSRSRKQTETKLIRSKQMGFRGIFSVFSMSLKNLIS